MRDWKHASYWEILGLVPVGDKVFALEMHMNLRGTSKFARFQFDEQLNRFTNIDDPELGPSPWIETAKLWWKDTFYGTDQVSEDLSTHILLEYKGTRYV